MRSNTKQEFQEVESKIKSAVERDKILYKKLKKKIKQIKIIITI